jgi:hypothetical protein
MYLTRSYPALGLIRKKSGPTPVQSANSSRERVMESLPVIREELVGTESQNRFRYADLSLLIWF